MTPTTPVGPTRRLTKAKVKECVADRRGWYLYRISKQLRMIPIANVYTPDPNIDWSTDLWVGTNIAPEPEHRPGLIHIGVEPTDPLDSYGSPWVAVITVPACCLPHPASSRQIDVELDDPDPTSFGADGGWLRGGRGERLVYRTAFHAARVWERHRCHEPSPPEIDDDPEEPAPLYRGRGLASASAPTVQISPSGAAWTNDGAGGGLL